MCTLFVLICPFLVSARTIYVSPTGNNSNDGLTASTPIRTLLKAKELCVNSSDDSFTILLEGGVTHNDFFPNPKVVD